MPHKKELKPPAELVDAIQNSEDMTAPEESGEAASKAFTSTTPRNIRNKLLHEEPQHLIRPEEQEQEGDHESKKERMEKYRAVRMEQQGGGDLKYNRDHPGAGAAGRGDNEVSSMANIKGDARKQQGFRDS